MLTIMVFEHFASKGNVERILIGQSPEDLTPESIALCRRRYRCFTDVYEWMYRSHGQPAAIYSPTTMRHRRTTELLFGWCSIPIVFDERLNPVECGEWRGRPTELLLRVPDGQPPEEFLSTPFPGGESWQDAVDRMRACLDDLVVKHPDDVVLVAGAAGKTRAMIRHLCQGTPLYEELTRHFSDIEGPLEIDPDAWFADRSQT